MNNHIDRNNRLSEYLSNWENYKPTFIYDFNVGSGGIGDCIIFYIMTLQVCMKHKIKLYYQINNTELEKYLKLKYDFLYIRNSTNTNAETIENIDTFHKLHPDKTYIIKPGLYYNYIKYEDIYLLISDVFTFSSEVIDNSQLVYPSKPNDYIAIHLRLGDKYLETDPEYIVVKQDVRSFDINKLYNFIEQYTNHIPIFFFCDNNHFKKVLKQKYPQLHMTTCPIGHTSLFNTQPQDVLNAITEFYLIVASNHICCVSKSGFSMVASKFHNTPTTILYE